MNETQLFCRLNHWLKPYRVTLALASINLAIIAITTALLPLTFSQVIDSIAHNDLEKFETHLLAILGLITTLCLANLASSYAINWMSGKIGTDLRITLFEKILALPVPCLVNAEQDKVYIYYFSKIDDAIDGINQLFSIQGKEILIMTSLLIVMLYINWEFSLMFFLITLIIGTIIQFISNGKDSNQDASISLIDTAPLIPTSSDNIKFIKLDCSQTQESQFFLDSFEQQRQLVLKQIVIKSLSKNIALIGITLVLAAILVLFNQQISLEKLTLGEAFALIIAALMLVFPLKRLLRIKSPLQNKFQVILDIDTVLAKQNEANSGRVEISCARGKIVFEKVSARTKPPACPSFINFSQTIHPQESIALMSATLGKEKTLIDLMARFLQPDQGRILLDDIDIATIRLANLRANIAWIRPDMRLLNDTIAANIAYGTRHCETEVSIMKVARTCHVTKFACEMPQGLQTKIGLNDFELAENQRQCIIIARALLKNPVIVIIDETTALFDLDCASVYEALDVLIRNRTTLIISSQPAMLRKAHRIIEI